MDTLTNEERVIVLELARIALSDAETYDLVADELDLSDETLKGLQEKIHNHLSYI